MKDYLILVNKENKLDKNYIPENLVKVTTKTGGDKLIYLEKTTYKQIKLLLKDMNKVFDTEIVIDSGYSHPAAADSISCHEQDRYSDTHRNIPLKHKTRLI